MSKISGLKETFDDRSRSFRSIGDPSSYIDRGENAQDTIFSTSLSSAQEPASRIVGGKGLFGTRYTDSLKYVTRRKEAYTEITETSKQNVSVYRNTRYVASPYSYQRIDDFFRKESYFSRSIYRQIETMMRNGYEFNSDDVKALQIVKRELARIERVNRIGFDQFIYQAAKNILKYGICVTRKLKDPKTKKLTRFICLKPQSVIFRFDNESGILLGVTDRNPSMFGKALSKVFKNLTKQPAIGSSTNNNEVPIADIGIALMYDPGEDIFPEPPCFQLLDDILTLRSLEETIELLAFQFGSPLLHVKAGSKEAPVTREQLLEIHSEFVNMASNGMVTTDFNTSVDVINLQKGIADLMPYVEHFKKRVLSGASSSSVSIGESDTGTRSSTESIDNALADHCAYISSIVAEMINTSIIPDILINNGYNEEQIYGPDGEFLVRMEFLDVDTAKMTSKENHILSLYQGNIITAREARRLMMRPPLTIADKNDMYLSNVQIPLREAGTEESASDASSAATKSKDQPSNQHGSKLSPGSTKK